MSEYIFRKLLISYINKYSNINQSVNELQCLWKTIPMISKWIEQRGLYKTCILLETKYILRTTFSFQISTYMHKVKLVVWLKYTPEKIGFKKGNQWLNSQKQMNEFMRKINISDKWEYVLSIYHRIISDAYREPKAY